MTARRRLQLAASGLLCLAALTACEKPAPIVTVVNEGRSVYAEAGIWCFEGQSGDSCATRNTERVELGVEGGTIGVDVDKELADTRWIATITDPEGDPAQGLTSGVQEDSHYYAFELGNLPAGTRLLLSVRALAEGPLAEGAEPEARGSWQFVLVPRD